MTTQRAEHEILHGRKLAAGNAELIWGWGSPAGQLRASRRAEMIIQSAGLRGGRRALEVGCGTGVFTALFSRSGVQLQAVDISAELLGRARERGLPPAQVQFVERRFEECEVEAPFDAVIGSSVLHHLDVPTALPKMFNLLRRGGWLCFAEPNMLNPQIFLERNVPWLRAHLGNSPDETAFVRWSLGKQLREAGFQQVRITPFDWLHPATPPGLIPAVRWLGSQAERLPGVREFAGSLLISARRPGN